MSESKTADLVIHNGTVVSGEVSYRASVAIKDGRIEVVGGDDAMPAAAEHLDAEGLHLLPGAIDVHVHFRDPGFRYKETWKTGTAAAAVGGVTTVFEMPNTNPPTATARELEDKLARADAEAYVDFGVYGLLAEDNIEHLEDLVAGGVIGFKCFMGNTFGNLPSPSTGAMLEGFERLAPTGLRVALHAETASIMARRYEQLRGAGRTDPRAHLAARPPVVAMEAVSRAAVLSEWTGTRIHVLHVSSAAELGPLADARARGVDVTAETCPHYLLFNDSHYDSLGSLIRVNPPIRTAADADALWRALLEGPLDMLATDHAPHLPEEKIADNIWEADCGFPGVETQMPLMLTAVNAGSLSLCDYVRLTAEAPAKSWGLYPRKGAIMPGCDADIAIVGMQRQQHIDASRLHSEQARVSPFDGTATTGAPLHTLVRGRFVMRDGALVASSGGHGRNVQPYQCMPEADVRNAAFSISAQLPPQDE